MVDGSVRLQGHYLDLLRQLHAELRPRTYVEVGMHTGKSLELVGPETAIIGIDPAAVIRRRINATARLFFDTSDSFFASHDVRELFGRPVDMAFIDGMHLWEYALRDFRNIERSCTRESMVMVHDCYPIDAASAARVRTTARWTGDTWKLVLCLRELRPDLEIVTVAAGPSGLTLIRNLDAANTVLHDRYDEAIERFGDLTFDAIADRRAEMLCAIDNTWDAIAPHLPSPYSEPGSMPAAPLRYPRHWKIYRHQVGRAAKSAGRKLVGSSRGAPA